LEKIQAELWTKAKATDNIEEADKLAELSMKSGEELLNLRLRMVCDYE